MAEAREDTALQAGICKSVSADLSFKSRSSSSEDIVGLHQNETKTILFKIIFVPVSKPSDSCTGLNPCGAPIFYRLIFGLAVESGLRSAHFRLGCKERLAQLSAQLRCHPVQPVQPAEKPAGRRAGRRCLSLVFLRLNPGSQSLLPIHVVCCALPDFIQDT
jgi:hypothetical protein